MSSRRVNRRINRTCLLTTAHLTNNPRLVKEADALQASGFEVVVVAARHSAAIVDSDNEIIRRSAWNARIIDWSREGAPGLFWYSRIRQRACHALLSSLRTLGLRRNLEWLEIRAFHRVLPEIRRTARSIDADLFIGHNPGLLPIAWRVAGECGAKSGFDAEDLHSGMVRDGEETPPEVDIVREWESRYLQCYDLLTAASPLIAEEYERRLSVSFDAVVLNAFDPVPAGETPRDSRQAGLSLYWVSQTIGANRGLEVVVRALGLLGDLPVRLYLRGDWQNGYEVTLRRLAAKVGVPDERIISLPRVAFDDLVGSALHYDVGLAVEEPTSRNSEVCVSNKILMYLSAGLAVAATDTPGQSLIMRQIPDAGFLFSWESHEMLARNLRCWIENPDRLRDAKIAASRAARDRFNRQLEQSKVARIVESILRRGAPRATAPVGSAHVG